MTLSSDFPFSKRQLLDQPEGWDHFGTNLRVPEGLTLEFSDALGDDGLPLWERCVPVQSLDADAVLNLDDCGAHVWDFTTVTEDGEVMCLNCGETRDISGAPDTIAEWRGDK
jgi:hypothetical protein